MCASHIGRNDPCPCGSGRKYKHCCLLHGAQRMVQQRNRRALDDFHGLSPDQMHALLYAPFDSPHVLQFASVLPVVPEATITTVFQRLCEAVDAGQLKATAKGNLPRAFCRDAWQAFDDRSPFSLDMIDAKVNREEDFQTLHITRLVAQEAGLLRKYKGHFIQSRRCKALRDEAGMRAIYPHLLQACARRFNWAYNDGYPDMPFIQQAFAFSLYLLRRYGDTPRSRNFYADAFLRAFPMLVDEADSSPWRSREEIAGRCFALRTLERFAAFMGLVTLSSEEGGVVKNEYSVSTTPLLDAVVCFHVPMIARGP